MPVIIKKIKSEICNYIIVREWIENGEFSNADTIIVIGTKAQAVMVNVLFRGSGKKVYYMERLHGKCRYRKWVKWIIFDRSLKRKLPQDDLGILFIPEL